jgi:hypothetical protein
VTIGDELYLSEGGGFSGDRAFSASEVFSPEVKWTPAFRKSDEASED